MQLLLLATGINLHEHATKAKDQKVYLKNSSAADLTAFKLERSSLRKIPFLPVCCCSCSMAASAFAWLLAAMYTFALCASKAYWLCPSAFNYK
jgi:hypothetical protein